MQDSQSQRTQAGTIGCGWKVRWRSGEVEAQYKELGVVLRKERGEDQDNVRKLAAAVALWAGEVLRNRCELCPEGLSSGTGPEQ